MLIKQRFSVVIEYPAISKNPENSEKFELKDFGYQNSRKSLDLEDLWSLDHPCEISVPWDHWYGRDLQKFRQLKKFGKVPTSMFEYPNIEKLRPGSQDRTCEILASCCDLQKFGKIRNSKFGNPNSGEPSPAPGDYSCKFLAHQDANCNRDDGSDTMTESCNYILRNIDI